MNTLKIAMLALLFTTASVAQTPRPPQQPAKPSSPDTIRVPVPLVNTFFTVSDKNGRFVTNLTKEDFKVYEDDERQVVSNFSSETDLPLSIALVIDTSSSIRDKMVLEQEAAIDFLYSNLRRGTDRATVISFDSGVDVRQEFTDDTETLAKAVRKIKVGGGTSLYDAIYLTIEERLSKEPEDRRKALIVISDGADNFSQRTFDETLELAQRRDIRIYSISTNQSAYFSSNERDRDDKILKRFAEETGGRASLPAKIADVSNEFKDIGEELRSQYSISYRPIKPDDGTFRRVRIDVTTRGLKAKARSGYYSPKSSPPGF